MMFPFFYYVDHFYQSSVTESVVMFNVVVIKGGQNGFGMVNFEMINTKSKVH